MKRITLLVLFFVTFLNVKSQDAATLLNSANALDHTVNNALDKANNILSEQQRTLYMNLVNYTAYLTGNLKYLSDDLDRKLTEKEIALLNDINAISTKLSDESEDWKDKLEDIGTIVDNAPTRIIGSDKYPTPTFYNMPLITTVQNKNIVIDIKGVRLNNINNYIVFQGKKIPVTSIYSDKKISFTVPLSEKDIFKSDTINTFHVALYKKRFLRKDKVYSYNPRFIVLPNKIGIVKVYYKTQYQDRDK